MKKVWILSLLLSICTLNARDEAARGALGGAIGAQPLGA